MMTKQKKAHGATRRERSWEWRSGEERRKRDRRRRAVLVELDRRGGFDRRGCDRRKS